LQAVVMLSIFYSLLITFVMLMPLCDFKKNLWCPSRSTWSS